MCFDHVDFPQYQLFWNLYPNPKPCLLPLTCATHLLAIQSTNVGSSLRSWICTGACITHCEGHRLLILNTSPINYAFYISLEAKLFRIWDQASWNWCCCRTNSSIADENIKAIYHVLDDNGHFKVHFVHRFLLTINIFSANSEFLHQMFGFFSMSRIWCVGCLQINREDFVDLCNTISLKLKGNTRCATFCLCLDDVPYDKVFFHVCFLRWISSELKCADCMSFIIVGQFVKRVDFFRPRVDVVLNDRLIIGGSMSSRFYI